LCPLQSIPGNFSFTTDAWTSKTVISFTSVRAHWINTNWEYKEIMVDFPVIMGNHFWKTIGNLFLESLDQIEIPLAKVFSLTMDNASNNDTCMNRIEEMATAQGLDFKIFERRIRCLAHVLNLAVQDVLKNLNVNPENMEDQVTKDMEELEDDEEWEEAKSSSSKALFVIVRKLRYLIKIKKSPQLRQKLNEICVIQDMKPLTPIFDVKTCWNSTFLMIQRAETLRSPIMALCVSVSYLTKLSLEDEEWIMLNKLSSFLENFEYATKIFSTSNQVICRYLPTFDYLIHEIETFLKETTDPHFQAVVSEAKLKLLKYKPELHTSPIPYFAVLLHPSMKMSYFKVNNYNKREMKNKSKRHFPVYDKKSESRKFLK
jgi:hypothetical protein